MIIFVSALLILSIAIYSYNKVRTLQIHIRNKELEANFQIINLQAQIAALRTVTIIPDNYVHKDIYKNTIIEYKAQLSAIQSALDKLSSEKFALQESLQKELSGKKSEQVRLGQISENLLPFLTEFNHNPKDLVALFHPIDYVCFEEDKITFIEVKTGDSALTTRQRNIQKLIESGNVAFEIHRLNNKGYRIK